MNEEQYKEKIEYLKKREKGLEAQLKDLREEMNANANCLKLGGYGGISVPLDDEVKEQIRKYFKKQFRKIIREDKDLEATFINIALNYKDAFIRIFRPIVKEMIEDLDFNVSFRADQY